MKFLISTVAPLYLLIKDHKGWKQEDECPPPSRPVCSGNKGCNRHLSEVLSLILEPLGHAIGGSDIDSTEGLLYEICELNKKLMIGADPSNTPSSSQADHRQRNETGDVHNELKIVPNCEDALQVKGVEDEGEAERKADDKLKLNLEHIYELQIKT